MHHSMLRRPLENRDGTFTVAFNDQNYLFPFNKVLKQWENRKRGLVDGIGSFFDMIPQIWADQSKIPPESSKL